MTGYLHGGKPGGGNLCHRAREDRYVTDRREY